MKTKMEIMEEVSKKLETLPRDTNNPPSLFEALGRIATEFSKANAENEARKSPEQRAQEAKQAAIRAEANAIEKTKKEQIRCAELLKIWIKRDTWLIYDEAMPLTKAEKPEEETMFNLRDEKLWALIQSCAGHSLQIINLDAKPKQWRVKPFEWVKWLKLKEQFIHPQLEVLMYPKTNIQSTLKTAKAIQSREIIKRDRQKAIKTFAEEIETRAQKLHIDWKREEIPVTKADFLEVLGKLNPAYKKISMDTFDRDIADIGLSFKRGTKSNKNNVLKTIFSIS